MIIVGDINVYAEDIEETIKATRERLKLLNTRKKTLQSHIKIYMQRHEVAQVITKNKTTFFLTALRIDWSHSKHY